MNSSQVIKLGITAFIGYILASAYVILSPLLMQNQLFFFLLPIMCVFFLFIILKPKETLVLLLLVRPVLDLALDRSKIAVGGTQFSAGAALNLAIIFLVVLLYFNNRNSYDRTNITRCWILYLLFILVASLHSPYFGMAIRLFLNNLTYLSMFLIPVFLIKTREDFKFWLRIIAISFILPVVFGDIDMIFLGGRYFPDSGQRITGSFAHPNILAFFMALGITIYFYILKGKSFTMTPRKEFIFKGLLVNMFILLLATKTRNAWIACFVAFFIYGLLQDRKFLLIFLMAIPLLFFVPSVQQRVRNAIDSSVAVEYKGINSFDWRIQMWKSSLTMIEKSPLLGYGLASFKPYSEKFSNVGANGAHNVYIELLFESGIGGMLSFLALLIAPAIWFFRRMREERGSSLAKMLCIVGAYVTSYILVCSADNMLYYLALNWYVWFFIGLMIAGYPFLREKSYE